MNDPNMPLLALGIPPDYYDKVIIYHANCPDGWMCAVLARLVFESRCVFLPAAYEQTFDEKLLPLFDKKEVYILDFSFSNEVHFKITQHASKLIVLDHHKTFAEALSASPLECFDRKHYNNSIAPARFVYDPNQCGAQMTYEYFNKPAACPKILVDYIGDRDLWKWELTESHAVNEYLATIPRTWKDWEGVMFDLKNDRLLDYIAKGRVALRVTECQVERLATAAFKMDILQYKDIPVCNTQSFQSEVGHRMLELNPATPFVAMYFDVDMKLRKWSLRGRTGDSFDCTTVAKQFGGGGHAKACGFKTEPSKDLA